MNRGLSYLAAMFAGVLLLGFAVQPAVAAKSPKIKAPRSFQAQFTLQEGANPPEQGTMYFSHGRIREEIAAAAGGPRIVKLINPAEKAIYQIDADKKVFKALPWDSRAALISEALRRSSKRKLVDTKTIDGQQCEDFEISPKDPRVGTFSIWINKTTQFPVELATKDSDPAKVIQIKWTNLSPGFQAPILFAPPLDYQEVK